VLWEQIHLVIVYFNDDDTVRFLLAQLIATNRYIDIKTTNTITDSNWHHIVLTYSGGSGGVVRDRVEIYIDGVQQTVSRSGNIVSSLSTLSSAPFNIGARDDQNVFMDGKIDEVAVFNSELSQSDVTAIYNGGTPNDISALNPLSWWRMGDNNGGTGTTITDEGSGGNNGTMINGPTFETDVP